MAPLTPSTSQNHFFYVRAVHDVCGTHLTHCQVDTRANPPRSIWTHPLDDPEYQRTHKKDAAPNYSGYLAPPGAPPRPSQSNPELGHGKKDSKHEKRGALEKLKDKLIGTKEEREAERQATLQRHEQERIARERMVRFAVQPTSSVELTCVRRCRRGSSRCASPRPPVATISKGQAATTSSKAITGSRSTSSSSSSPSAVVSAVAAAWEAWAWACQSWVASQGACSLAKLSMPAMAALAAVMTGEEATSEGEEATLVAAVTSEEILGTESQKQDTRRLRTDECTTEGLTMCTLYQDLVCSEALYFDLNSQSWYTRQILSIPCIRRNFPWALGCAGRAQIGGKGGWRNEDTDTQTVERAARQKSVQYNS